MYWLRNLLEFFKQKINIGLIGEAAPSVKEQEKPTKPLPRKNEMNTKGLSLLIPESVLAEISEIQTKFIINTPKRLSHFLAQTAHESGEFKFVRENLNYSASALRAVFGRHFPTDEIAEQYARQPERIANRAYGNRMGNGNEASGDGWKFRGRGYIQLTGRNNYTSFNEYVSKDVVENPDLVATEYPLLSAAWFWYTNSLNSLADAGDDEATIRRITRRVNGGLNGIDDRIKKFYHYYEILNHGK